MKKMKKLMLVLAMVSVGAGCVAATPPPVAMQNSAVGGGPLNAYTPGVTGGIGTNNIGLLIQTWGSVTYIDTTNKFFYIDDGAGLLDQSGYKGVRVSYDGLLPTNTFNPPTGTGQYVSVIGISSTSAITVMVQGQPQTNIIPTVRPRGQSDMVTLVP